MSGPESYSELVFQLEQGRVDNGIIFGLSALVFYEYVITLQDEIDMIWRRRWNAATILFVVNRYLMLLYNAVGLVIPTTLRSCTAVQILLDILTVLLFIVFAVFATLRLYAIWNRNIPISLLILALYLVPVVSNTYAFATDTIGFFVDPDAGPQCFEMSKLSDGVNSRLSLSTRLCLMVADAIVLLLTWRKTFGMKTRASRLSLHTPFLTLIIRDGTIYFIALLLMNIAQIIMKEFPKFSSFPPTILFINSLTPVLISRFLINLRRANTDVVAMNRGQGGQERTVHDEETRGDVSTMRFSTSGNAHTQTTQTTATAAMSDSRVERLLIGPMGGELGDGSDFGSSMPYGDEDESSGSSGYKSEEDAGKRFDVPLETKEKVEQKDVEKELPSYDQDAASRKTRKGKEKEVIEEVERWPKEKDKVDQA